MIPVLATKDGRIIAGHGRVEAAKRLGVADVPVMTAQGWTDAQVRAYTIADNRLALNAAWDENLLSVELDELRDIGADLTILGFLPAELNDLIGTPNLGPTPEQGSTGDAAAMAQCPKCGCTFDHRTA